MWHAESPEDWLAYVAAASTLILLKALRIATAVEPRAVLRLIAEHSGNVFLQVRLQPAANIVILRPSFGTRQACKPAAME